MEIFYKISDILDKNISESFDIVLFNPIFLTVNIQNVQMYLFDEKNNSSDILNGYHYEIIVSGLSIYYGLISSIDKNLFISENIPFSYNIFHKCLFVIYNLSNETVKKISNYTITFKYFLDTNLPLYIIGQIPIYPHEIKWNYGIYETNSEKNSLRFIGGMSGMTFRPAHELEFLSDDYLQNNKKIFYYDDNFEKNNYIILNISHLDESNNWVDNYKSMCNNYSITKILNTLVTQEIPNGLKKKYYIVSETLKIPLWNKNFIKCSNTIDDNKNNNMITNKFVYKYKYSMYDKPDAISNIKFICDPNKYVLVNVDLSYGDVSKIGETHDGIHLYGDVKFGEKYELEFVSTKYGYKISGLNNFIVIPTLKSTHTIIEIKFYISNDEPNNKIDNILLNDKLLYDTPNDFWIKYDRYCIDAGIRKKIFDDFFNWEEYPFIELIDYLPECHDRKIFPDHMVQNNLMLNQNQYLGQNPYPNPNPYPYPYPNQIPMNNFFNMMNIGAVGPIGATGASGLSGPMGATGPSRLSGPMGATGNIGPG